MEVYDIALPPYARGYKDGTEATLHSAEVNKYNYSKGYKSGKQDAIRGLFTVAKSEFSFNEEEAMQFERFCKTLLVCSQTIWSDDMPREI